MAGRGPAPKEPSKRVRRNRVEETTLEQAAKRKPAPRSAAKRKASASRTPLLPGARSFLPATRRWYQVWSRSLQASQFIETDWLRLHMIARLVDQFYRAEDATVAKQLMSEIRLNEQKLGGTPEDRLRLRWRLSEAEREADRGSKEPGRPRARGRRADPRLRLVEGGSA